MEFKDIVSITGMGGLYVMDAQKPNGCIVTSLENGKTGFVSSRNHLFTMLENISIYTDTDSEELINIFIKMKEVAGETPVASAKASSEELKTYMGTILPDYDRDRVYVSDIKKMLKWFAVLEEKGLIDIEKSRMEAEEKESKEENADSGEENTETA